MAGPAENPQPVLELDDQQVEGWSIHATFLTGDMSDDEARAIIFRDPVVAAGGSILVTEVNHRQGTVRFMTNQYIEGTQRAALESISQRFVAMLGDLAVAERVMDAGMNVGAVADALAAAVLAKYGLEDWYFDDDEDMPDGWEEIGDESETPSLDVTAHLKRLLGTRDI